MAVELNMFGRVVWEDRYGLRDESGALVEKDIFDTFHRASKFIARNEKKPDFWENEFYRIMSEGYYSPAGRVLAHSGTNHPQLLNCFVLPFRDDSLEEIMHTATDMAITQKYGGGTGFNHSKLRPAGSYIKGVNGRSCGVLGFLNMMSVTSEVIEQGGSRRGANLGLLEVDHPDIWEYISYKTEHNWDRLLEFMEVKDREQWEAFKYNNLYKLQMFNISVGINDDFLDAVKKDMPWQLKWHDKEWPLYKVLFRKFIKEGQYKEKVIEVVADSESTAIWKAKRYIPFPRAVDQFKVESHRTIMARELFRKICYNAWADGCPGLINLSSARRMHNLEYARPILSTNPCGEQLLAANSSCNLSSINLASMVKDGKIDYAALAATVTAAVRFSDNVIDNCEFPLKEILDIAKKERRVGLGVMGLHDMLMKLKLCYDSDEGRAEVAKVMEVILHTAYNTSIDLAIEKGPFPLYDRDKYMQSGFVKLLPKEIQDRIYKHGIRNSTLISIAPTGTIGAMYNVSTGCEPWFMLQMQRDTRLGSFDDGCPEYLKWREQNKDAKEVPAYFKTAMEIKPDDHIKMLILMSKYVDSSSSKTINMPNETTVEEVEKAFLWAMENGIKGITIFRDGSKAGVFKKIEDKSKEPVKEPMKLDLVPYVPEGHPIDTRVEPILRGNRTMGATTRIRMRDHNIYITVNKNDDGDLVEVFTAVGTTKNPNFSNTCGVEDSWAEACAKIISLALRAGVKPTAIIKNLKNIPSDKPVFETIGNREESELIPSPPHAIARVMEEELKVMNKLEETPSAGVCSNCGSTRIRYTGQTCYECLNCAHKSCGG